MSKQNRYLAVGLAWLAGLASVAVAEDTDLSEARKALVELSKEIEREVEALRGWKFKRPVQTDIRTRDELLTFIKGKIAEEYGPGKMSRKQAMLRMIGMIPPDCEMVETLLEVLSDQIGGFYDPDKQTFYMMVREGMETTGAMGRVVIAHELTHALDDQHLDLEGLMELAKGSEDRELAIGAVVEGSATFLMTRYIVTPPYNQKLSPEELAASATAEMKTAQKLLEAPRYFSVLLANYICGMNFMAEGNQALIMAEDAGARMRRNLLAVRKDPPSSSEQILHPEKYWKQRDEPVVIRDELVQQAVADAGLKIVHRDTIGEVLLGILTAPIDEPMSLMGSQLPTYWTNEAASGWGGDRFFLLSDKAVDADAPVAGKLAGLWITAWDRETDREEFEEDYAFERDELPLTRRAYPLGPRVVVYTFGLDADAGDRLAARLRQVPGLFTRDGQTWSSQP